MSFVPHPSITTNGPPVKLVSVAERLKAVTTKILLRHNPDIQPEREKHGVAFALLEYSLS